MYEIKFGKVLDLIQQNLGDDTRIVVDACYVEKNSRCFHSYIGTLCYNKPVKMSRVGMIKDIGFWDEPVVRQFRDCSLIDFEDYNVSEVSYHTNKYKTIEYIYIEIEIPIAAGVLNEGL